MALIHWPSMEAFDDLERRFFEDFPRFLREPSRGFVPAVDVYETKDAVIVESPLAGVDPEKVDIAIENNVLTVKGSSEKKSEVEEKDYYRKEVRYGSFYRTVTLPVPVQGEKASASYEKGLLRIEIPKSGESKAKKIEVKVKK